LPRGRCEADHVCTGEDDSCAQSHRRYSHAAGHHDECFTGLVTPIDYCAADQPPAPDEGCAHAVCAELPSCCTTTWGDACVMAAQLAPACGLACDLRVAIVAQHNAFEPELWDLRYADQQWHATRRTDRQTLIGWLAPPPGGVEPRLAAIASPSALVVESSHGASTLALDPESVYHDLQSLDLDRDLRDTIVLDSSNTRRLGLEVLKVDTDELRGFDLNASARMSFGALTTDGVPDIYPDLVVNQGSDYRVDESIFTNDPLHLAGRQMAEIVQGAFGDNTPGSAGPLKAYAWADVDGDHALDIVAFASSLRVYTDARSVTPFVDVDCDPPSVTPTCVAASVSYTGAVWPTATGIHLLVAPFDQGAQTRKLIQIDVHPDHTITETPFALPQVPACTNCSIQAVIVRDLDGDHVLDLVLIDSQLTVLVALSKDDPSLHTWTEVHPMIAATPPYTNVKVSVSGAPSP
ncbi:MAG: hypothetical protein ABI678_14555, partial [Kofleriaceae bacterium]